MRRRVGWLVVVVLVVGAVWLLRGNEPAPASPAPTPSSAPATKRAAPPAAPPKALPPVRPLPAKVETAAAAPCVRGEVRSGASGAPIARAEVTLETDSGASSVTTGPDGHFELRLGGPARLSSITAAGFHPWLTEWGHSPLVLTPAPGTCVGGLIFMLWPRAALAGVVVSPQRQPVAGARITVHTETGGTLEGSATSAEDGTFTVEAPDEAMLVAEHPDFEPGVAHLGAIEAVTHAVTVTLGPARPEDAGALRPATLHGRVLDGHDAGLAGALVHLRRVLFSPDGGRSDEVDEQSTESETSGAFAFQPKAGSRWAITAEAEGLRPASAETTGEPVELRLLGGATLEGTVTGPDGQPVPSFVVQVLRRVGAFDVWPPTVRSFVDPRGHFRVEGLGPGPVSVTAMAFGLAASPAARAELQLGETASVALTLTRGGGLEGRVTSLDGGAVGDALVSLEGGGGGLLSQLSETRTDARGSFVLTGVSEGRHSVLVAAAGYHARLLPPVDFQPERVAGPVMVKLSPVGPGETPDLELMGVGAALKAIGDALVVQQVVRGGGAAEVGLAPGDGVLTIDGTPVVDLGFVGSIERIRGPEDTTVRLEVRRGDGTLVTLDVPRRRIRAGG